MSSIVFGSYTVIDDSPLEILEPIVSSSSIITISPACEIGVNSGTSSVIQINNGISFVVQSSLGDRSEYNYIVWNPSNNISLNVGYATLASGTITINNNLVNTNSLIFLSRQSVGSGVSGNLSYNINPSVGFTINSTSVNDNSIVNWWIVN